MANNITVLEQHLQASERERCKQYEEYYLNSLATNERVLYRNENSHLRIRRISLLYAMVVVLKQTRFHRRRRRRFDDDLH